MVQADAGQSANRQQTTGTVNQQKKAIVAQFLEACALVLAATRTKEEEVVAITLVKDRMEDLLSDYRIIKTNE